MVNSQYKKINNLDLTTYNYSITMTKTSFVKMENERKERRIFFTSLQHYNRTIFRKMPILMSFTNDVSVQLGQ